MHMADALLSPAVGGVMWATSLGATAYSARKIRTNLDERTVPLMGVLGAFIFAAQMINFSIPGTGSSGHLGGGLILAILLGPYAGFLTVASILTIQALFFADGGLLALGCNIFNMGFIACFIAYPLIFKPLTKKTVSSRTVIAASILAAVIGLQLGAFGVVLETVLSGITALPFSIFILLMQPIHLAIGVVEGLVTAAVIVFIQRARPELLDNTAAATIPARTRMKKALVGLAIVALLTGGAFSWFASTSPDGLEWSIFHASGQEELPVADHLHRDMARIQQKTVILPDYGFKKPTAETDKTATAAQASWPSIDAGTSIAGIVGGVFTLLLAGSLGLLLRYIRKSPNH